MLAGLVRNGLTEGAIQVEKRNAESVIVSVYSVYALALMFATTILGWPGWITPIISSVIMAVWFVYLKGVRDYRFRALLYSAVALATFALYNLQENSFGGILITYCAAIIVLSILDIPEIVVPEYICSVLLIAYHGLVSNTIPFDTTQEKIRSAVQILSVFAVVGITHRLIKKHEATGQHMRQMIAELEEAEQRMLEFMSHVSREFKVPVNAICGTSEMILQEEPSDGVREHALEIQDAGRSLLSMIGDVT